MKSSKTIGRHNSSVNADAQGRPAAAPRHSLAAGYVRRYTAGQALDANTFCIYNLRMEFSWSEAKRAANLKAHGIDFVDAAFMF